MPTEAFIRYIKKDCTGLVSVTIAGAANDDPVEDATVQVTLLDEAAQPLAGQAWPLMVPHVEEGVYEGYLSEQLEGEIGTPYNAKMLITSPTQGVSNLVIPVQFEMNQG